MYRPSLSTGVHDNSGVMQSLFTSNFVNKLRRSELTDASADALLKLEAVLASSPCDNQLTTAARRLVDEFIVSCAPNSSTPNQVQSLHILLVICDHFLRPVSQVLLDKVFMSVFQPASLDLSGGADIKRVETLCHLVSLALSIRCVPILTSAAVFMQHLGATCPLVLHLTNELIKQHVINNNNNSSNDTHSSQNTSPTFLDQLPMLARPLVVSLLNSVAHVYRAEAGCSETGSNPIGSTFFPPSTQQHCQPPVELIRQVVTWFGCMSGVFICEPPVSSSVQPCDLLFASLLGWTVVLPLTAASLADSGCEQLLARLQAQLLRVVAELQENCLQLSYRARQPPQLFSSDQLTAVCDQLCRLGLAASGGCRWLSAAQLLAVDRLAQLFIAVTTVSAYSGSAEGAVAQFQRLHKTALVKFIIDKHR